MDKDNNIKDYISIVEYGQNEIFEFYKVIYNKEELDINKLNLINNKLDVLIQRSEKILTSYYFDLEYYRIQSLNLNTKGLKYQYLLCKTKYDLFNNRIEYLKDVKKSLCSMINNNEMQLKQ